MKTLLVLAALMAADSPRPEAKAKLEAVQEADGWEGIYTAVGKEADTVYAATVTVVKVKGEHVVAWTVFTEKGSYSFLGIGMAKGDTLSVGWRLDEKAGVHVMRRAGDGAEGTWVAMPGQFRRWSESWKYIGKAPKVLTES